MTWYIVEVGSETALNICGVAKTLEEAGEMADRIRAKNDGLEIRIRYMEESDV